MPVKRKLIRLFLPTGSNVCDFLKEADTEDLIRLQRIATFEEEAMCVVQRSSRDDTCACRSVGGMVVVDETFLTIVLHRHEVNGYPGYVLPFDCSNREAVILVAWFIRYEYYTHSYTYMNIDLTGYLKHKGRGKSLIRCFRSTDGFFAKENLPCGRCIRLRLRGDIAFCTGNIVLSENKKGPMVKSVFHV
jgi:hypothetical protein